MTFVIPPQSPKKLPEDAYYALGSHDGVQWFNGILRALTAPFGATRRDQEATRKEGAKRCTPPMALSSRGEAG